VSGRERGLQLGCRGNGDGGHDPPGQNWWTKRRQPRRTGRVARYWKVDWAKESLPPGPADNIPL